MERWANEDRERYEYRCKTLLSGVTFIFKYPIIHY